MQSTAYQKYLSYSQTRNHPQTTNVIHLYITFVVCECQYINHQKVKATRILSNRLITLCFLFELTALHLQIY